MRNIKRARFVELSFLFLAVCFSMLFNPSVVKAQGNSKVECKTEAELVQGPLEYNEATGRYEYRYRYKYVTRCVPTLAETNSAASSGSSSSSALAPSGEIRKLWVDHDVYDNRQKGMRIHLTFSAQRLKNKQCTATAYFYYASGKPLKDFNDKYSTTDGKVGMHADFTPSYASSVYKDFQLFMPHTELHMAPGEFDLKFFVKLRCEGIGLIARSKDYTFTYSSPK